MDTSPLPVKGFKFWPLLGTHGHWAAMVFKRTVTRDSNLYGPVTLTSIAERLAVELSLPVFTTVAAGIRSHSLSLPRRTLLPTAPPPRSEVTPSCQSLSNTESASSYKCRCFVNWFRPKFAKMDEIPPNRVTNANQGTESRDLMIDLLPVASCPIGEYISLM